MPQFVRLATLVSVGRIGKLFTTVRPDSLWADAAHLDGVLIRWQNEDALANRSYYINSDKVRQFGFQDDPLALILYEARTHRWAKIGVLPFAGGQHEAVIRRLETVSRLRRLCLAPTDSDAAREIAEKHALNKTVQRTMRALESIPKNRQPDRRADE
ncbi:MAG: hypothetical protein JXQ27_12465 [Acidobacteria bacterium]|nr:hypothetical protein [Acidobacteriota bacterium]